MVDPLRRCVYCKTLKPRSLLVRFVLLNKKLVVIKKTFKPLRSKSIYVCKDKKCFLETKKAKKIEKIFKINISKDLWQKLENLIKF